MQFLAELEAGGCPSALGALAANRRLADLLDGQRLYAIGEAVGYEGATWQQVGESLGISRQAAHKGFFAALERQERVAADFGWVGTAQELS